MPSLMRGSLSLVAALGLVLAGCGEDDPPIECQPETCESLEIDCGTRPDGCGGELSCPACPDGFACNDENMCVDVPCEPNPCTEQPPATCNAAETGIVTYSAVGVCEVVDGEEKCTYATTEQACEASVSCNGDEVITVTGACLETEAGPVCEQLIVACDSDEYCHDGECLPLCGNDRIDDGEVCDGTALGDETCETMGFGGGTLACNADCLGFDTSACTPLADLCDPNPCTNPDPPACNAESDGIITYAEVGSCEVVNEEAQCTYSTTVETCTTSSVCHEDTVVTGTGACVYDGETPVCETTVVSCGADEYCDAGACLPLCGNNQVDEGEVCDGTDLDNESCESLGFLGGTLACSANCQSFDIRSCEREECLAGTPDVDIGSAVGAAVATGTTVDHSNDHFGTCTSGSDNAPDVAIVWSPPADGCYVIDTFGSSFDTVLFVKSCEDETEIVCNDDSGGLQSRVVLSAQAGSDYLIVVDGYGSGSGDYILNIALDPCACTTCNSAPAAHCTQDGSGRVTYASAGTCDGSTGTAVCTYTETVHDCDSPPSSHCAGDVWVSYAAEGQCDDDTAACVYDETTEDCSMHGQICRPEGCQDSVAGIGCSSPATAEVGFTQLTGTFDDVLPSGTFSCVSGNTTNIVWFEFTASRTGSHEITAQNYTNTSAYSRMVVLDGTSCEPFGQEVDCDTSNAKTITRTVSLTEGETYLIAFFTDGTLYTMVNPSLMIVQPADEGCDPNPCDSPPLDAAWCNADNTGVLAYANPGFCSNVGGEIECDYGPFETLCVAGQECLDGACVRSVCIDEFSPNHSLETAAALALPASIQDLSVCKDTSDFFSFQVCAGGTIEIDVLFTHANGDIEAMLYNAAGVTLVGSYSGTDNERLVWINPAEGDVTVYLEVYLWSGTYTSQNTYAIEASVTCPVEGCEDDEYAGNDSIENAVMLELGLYEGLKLCDDTPDFFAFVVCPGGTIDIDVLFSHADGDIDIYLLNAAGTELASSCSGDDNESVSWENLSEDEVTVYLHVENFDEIGEQTYAMEVAVTGCPEPATCRGTVVISQVYGGGGNAGALYTHDFVELHNMGTSEVSLDGWSIQYAAATGSTWNNKLNLEGTIEAGGFFLIRLAGGATGVELPTPDQVGNINMAGANGKVALLDTTDQITTGSLCPLDDGDLAYEAFAPHVIDMVSYGSGTDCIGSATPALSNSTAAIRLDAGCRDTRDNSADFFVDAPMPRNASSDVSLCNQDCYVNETDSELEADWCVVMPEAIDCVGCSWDVFGEIYKAGITGNAEADIVAHLGWGPGGVNPQTQAGFEYLDATFHELGGLEDNNNVYRATIPSQASGIYRYVYRFSLDGGDTWTYCDTTGSGSDSWEGVPFAFDPEDLGTLTVVD